jgi:uncharacterized protein YjbJ (UPF0337 family)
MVSVDVFEHKWKELRSHVRPRWISLTDEDVARIDGKVDVLIELLREKYGYTEAQAETEVNRFIQEMGTAKQSNPN